MAKRFVDTGLYDKPWFRKLSLKSKCLWEYLRLKCNHAGIIELDLDLASFQIGETVTEKELNELSDHVSSIGNEKFFLLDFIEFQYGKLNINNRAHKSAIDILLKHDLLDENLNIINRNKLDPNKPLTSPLQGCKVKDKDKDKDKVKDKDKEKESCDQAQEAPRTTSDLEKNLFHQIVQLWNDMHGKKLGKIYMMPSAIDLQNYKTTQGHLTDLKAWRDLFEKCEGTKLTGADKNFKCTWFGLGWLFKSENAANVINGQWPKLKADESGETSDDMQEWLNE